MIVYDARHPRGLDIGPARARWHDMRTATVEDLGEAATRRQYDGPPRGGAGLDVRNPLDYVRSRT